MSDITESIITEFEHREVSPRWYHSFVGDVSEKEPKLASWLWSSNNQALMGLGRNFSNLFAQAPALASHIDDLLRRWFLRGFYMGMRKYTEELKFGVGVDTPLSDPKIGRRPPPPGPEFQEEEDINPGDFDDPDSE